MGAKYDIRNQEGFTPFLIATKNGHAEIVKLLINLLVIKNKVIQD